jgi:hypothetical protein
MVAVALSIVLLIPGSIVIAVRSVQPTSLPVGFALNFLKYSLGVSQTGLFALVGISTLCCFGPNGIGGTS